MVCYKVFVVENGELKNLFKGIEGTRTITFNEWLYADKKWGRDGGNSRWYLTGIHCLKEKEKAIDYLDNFRTEKDRVIVKIQAKGLRQKPTNQDVYLADKIKVTEEDYLNAERY